MWAQPLAVNAKALKFWGGVHFHFHHTFWLCFFSINLSKGEKKTFLQARSFHLSIRWWWLPCTHHLWYFVTRRWIKSSGSLHAHCFVLLLRCSFTKATSLRRLKMECLLSSSLRICFYVLLCDIWLMHMQPPASAEVCEVFKWWTNDWMITLCSNWS